MAEPAGEEPVGEASAVPALREGYLEKKMKSKLRGFKKRWFVLLPGKLEYYLTEEERAEGKEPKGIIPLAHGVIEKPHGRSAERNAFRLSFNTNNVKLSKNLADADGTTVDAKQLKYVLAAETVEDQMGWEEAVREQIWEATVNPDEREKKERRLTGFDPPEKLVTDMSMQPAIIEEEEYDEDASEEGEEGEEGG